MWTIHRIVNFRKEDGFSGIYTRDGYSLLGLHARDGSCCVLGPERDWIGCLDAATADLSWTVGPKTRNSGSGHITADLRRPSWIHDCGRGIFLVANSGRNQICVLDVNAKTFSTLIELGRYGVLTPANCLADSRGNVWVNDPSQSKLWVFHRSGELLRTLENENRGDRAESTESPLEEMRLGEVYDMRLGTDGAVYILEGARFQVRAIYFEKNLARTIAGSGAHGYTGDGGDPLRATFGSRRSGDFDGPWALCLDDRDAVFVADTQNGAVRMIDRLRASIQTIAGGAGSRPESGNDPAQTDPLNLALSSIFWMDWSRGRLFISDESGDLVVLVRGRFLGLYTGAGTGENVEPEGGSLAPLTLDCKLSAQ
jgi:hypothetical protein